MGTSRFGFTLYASVSKTDTKRKISWLNPKAKHFGVVHETKPKHTYRGAVVGCGRMGSTIDDEHIGMPHYPWPWAHAPAMIEARGVDLIAAADVDQAKLDDFQAALGGRCPLHRLSRDGGKGAARHRLPDNSSPNPVRRSLSV